MKRNVRILAMLLALITVVSVFAACGEPVDTTVDATETDAPETDAPESDADENDTPETTPVEEEPEIDPVILTLDFETDLPFAEYIGATEGVALNTALNGGNIVDGKWVYSGVPMAIEDQLNIFSYERYSIEFDFCFNSFVNKDSTSVFSFITDDDGTLNGETSNFYVPFKLDMNGVMYHNSARNMTVQLEAGKTYHYKATVNNEDNKITVEVDGSVLVAANFNVSPREYNCFRVMDNNRGADMWIDNLVVTDVIALQNASSSKEAKAVDAAYVRAGKYADQVLGLADGIYVDIKLSGDDPNYHREGFVKFDISKLKLGKVNRAYLYTNFASINMDSVFDIYWVGSKWDSDTITYNNMPLGKLIIDDVKFTGVGEFIDLAPYINEALQKGEKFFSIRIIPVNQPTSGQTRLSYTVETKPVITIVDDVSGKNYTENLTDDESENMEIWAYAQTVFDEWYARYQSLEPVNEDAVLLGRDDSQYTKTNYSSSQSTNYASSKTAHKSRPLSALTDFDQYVSKEFKNAKLDKYGGIMVESLKQKATGYFYVEKIDGRWWMIDPLGYPYISIGLSDIHYSQLGSQLQKDNAIKIYGDYDSWALATTRQVIDELYFNNSFRPVSNIVNVENGMPFAIPGSLMGNYGSLKGVLGDGNGSTAFTENNTMPVFDPAFASYADNWVKTKVKDYVGNDRLIGYMSDNELPMNADMLDRSLSVNHAKEANYYTYACAWTWLKNMTGKENPSGADVTDELRDLYRGFVWDRYFNIVSAAYEKYDADHLYLGVRFLTVSRESQWVYRFAAQYLDIMTINWYGDWEPDANALYGIEKNGDLPFIITEFYTKAGDSGLGNTSGAGRYVATQTDRADFYETFTIRLLESNNCVGWQWFQYMDNDPNSGTGDASSVDSNKGLYKSDFTLYTELAERMTELNKNVYNIIDYFANKNAK